MNIIIGGDFYPGGKIESYSIETPHILWGDVLPALKKADLRIVNLECPLTIETSSITKTGPILKARPETINALEIANIDLVTLANNHIYDYGDKGLADTLNICQQHGIATVGAGLTSKQARTTWYREIKGKRLAVINFSENEWSRVGESRGGSNPYDLIDNAKQIRLARKNAEIVLVIIHGGHEYYQYPSHRMVKEYRFFVEQGASAIVGHHTHCYSGYEVYNDVPIFYSLGNLLFDANTKFSGWYQGFLLELEFDNSNHAVWKLHPYYQTIPKPGIWTMSDEDKTGFFLKIDDINRVIENPAALKERWELLVKERSDYYLGLLSITWRLLVRVLIKMRLMRLVIKPFNFMQIHNFLRCESHRDILISVLDDHRNENNNETGYSSSRR